MTKRATEPGIPASSLILGYGPMLPLVLAAFATWFTTGIVPVLALRLAIIWAALVLAFIAGVRRGFGFGADRTSTWSETTSAIAYFGLAALALVAPFPDVALALLAVGFVLAAILDRRAALAGNAPLHFARLRPPQLAIGVVALAALWAWLAVGGTR